ncbi:MAG: S24 family peptidase, partial [Oscillospiraceae bacterium]|nr:S24 family peptidase [Oscillospiraceae bacterium]
EAEPRLIPLYRTPAAAGYASPVCGEDFDYITVDESVPFGADFGVRIQGDSMEPHIADGSVVYVTHEALASGDVGIFCVDGDMLCKQYHRDALGMTYLFSLNRKRADADLVFGPDSGRTLVCFGRVLTAHRYPLP